MKAKRILTHLGSILAASLFFANAKGQTVTVFSENFDAVVNPYTSGATFINTYCNDFIVSSNLDPSVCNFSLYPITTDASGSGKFLFEGTIDLGGGVTYNDNFYTTTTTATLLAGITYTIQFDVALANNIHSPQLTASLDGVPLGAAVTPTTVNSWQTISFTLTPAADMVNPVFNLYDATSTGDGNDFGIDNIKFSYTSSGALPVHFTGFSAKPEKAAVLLQWSTGNETSNKYFAVERSADRLNYTAIGTVNGAGTSTVANNYSFTDAKPVAGTSYYRLKQVDNDGKFIYSNIVSTHFSVNTISMSTYPNPVGNHFSISLEGGGSQVYTVAVTDLSGAVILKKELAAENGQLQVRLNSKPAPGIYMVSVKGNNTEAVSKIVVH